MLKNIVAAMLLAVTAVPATAGLVDHGDDTLTPYAYDNKTLVAVKYFPEITTFFPKGLSRTDAWTQDIKRAAEGTGVSPAKLAALLQFVLHPFVVAPESAPHKQLLEFELYARGMRTVGTGIPDEWKQLLALPLEQRRYTTIPVLHNIIRHALDAPWSLKHREQYLQKMIASYKDGCLDTQGCILKIINDIGRNPKDYTDRTSAYKFLLRKTNVNVKNLLYPGQYDITKTPGEIDANWDSDIDLDWALYTESEANLRKMASEDLCMRDLIVTVGLTNREMPEVRKVAKEFAMQSKINYPLLAVKSPLPEALKILAPYPQYNNLRDALIINSLQGKAKIDAIERYLATYPDGDIKENGVTVITMKSHELLHAIAGAELFKLGSFKAAAAHYLKGCTPEDMGMLTEQVMTIDELIAFCEKHFPYPVDKEQQIYSADCTHRRDNRYMSVLDKDQINFMVRNLLARRLMRAGRFAEGRKYFTGDKTRKYSEKYFQLHAVVSSATTSREEKFHAAIAMAELVRFHGDKIFGTFLEPDNLISKNNYPCTWGTKLTDVKLKKPDLPRYSYRYRAAEIYGQAADMTDDRNIKAYILWTAGTMLKKLSPKTANIYFTKLIQLAPELTEKNWFLPIKKAPAKLQKFYHGSYYHKEPDNRYL